MSLLSHLGPLRSSKNRWESGSTFYREVYAPFWAEMEELFCILDTEYAPDFVKWDREPHTEPDKPLIPVSEMADLLFKMHLSALARSLRKPPKKDDTAPHHHEEADTLRWGDECECEYCAPENDSGNPKA
jgi:hypothetical protein